MAEKISSNGNYMYKFLPEKKIIDTSVNRQHFLSFQESYMKCTVAQIFTALKKKFIGTSVNRQHFLFSYKKNVNKCVNLQILNNISVIAKKCLQKTLTDPTIENNCSCEISSEHQYK